MVYPLVVLSSWLIKTIDDKVDDFAKYLNNIVAKGFIKYEAPGSCNIDWTPVLRIFKFTKTTPNGEISAILNDSTHKILAIFTRDCIIKFESKYSQRLTYHTLHSLIIVRKANLRFALGRFIRESFGSIGSIELLTGTEAVYLEILEIELFQRDPMDVDASHENKLKFVYGNDSYRTKFDKVNANVEAMQPIVDLHYDGVISEDEM